MTSEKSSEPASDVDELAPSEVAAPAPAAAVKTAEQWAEQKGMLPEFIEAHAPFAAAGSAPVRTYNPEFWRFAATKAGSSWPQGKELTEAEFDAAVTAATTQTYR